MDKVIQQNAASAEESSSAASQLSGQAEELAAMVGAFQLAREERSALRRPSLAAHAPQGAKNGGAKHALAAPAKRGARAAKGNAFPMDDESAVRDF